MDYKTEKLVNFYWHNICINKQYLEGSRRELLWAEMKGLLFRSAARKCSQEIPTPPSDRWTTSIWAKENDWYPAFCYKFDQKRWYCWLVLNIFLSKSIFIRFLGLFCTPLISMVCVRLLIWEGCTCTCSRGRVHHWRQSPFSSCNSRDLPSWSVAHNTRSQEPLNQICPFKLHPV